MMKSNMKHRTYDTIISLLHTSFPKKQTLRVIDYGCGSGLLLSFLSPDLLDLYEGYDVNIHSLEAARKKFHQYPHLRFHQISAGSVPHFSHQVDAIILVGVVQYMSQEELEMLLEEAKKTLSNDGVIICSTANDHLFYKMIDLYRFFFSHTYVNREKLTQTFLDHGYAIPEQFSRGIFMNPVFSGVIAFAADGIDAVLAHSKGRLGPFGRAIRSIFRPLLNLEYVIPIDYGDTLYTKATVNADK